MSFSRARPSSNAGELTRHTTPSTIFDYLLFPSPRGVRSSSPPSLSVAASASRARSRPRPTLSPVSCGSGVGRRTTDPGATVLSPHMLQNRATGDSPNPHRAHSVSSLGLPSRDEASPRPRYGNTRLLMPRPAYPPAAHSGAAEPPPNLRTPSPRSSLAASRSRSARHVAPPPSATTRAPRSNALCSASPKVAARDPGRPLRSSPTYFRDVPGVLGTSPPSPPPSYA